MAIERILGTDTGKNAFYKADRNFQVLDEDKIDITQFKEATGYGVISGLSVSPQTVANMTVKVSAGIVHMPDGKRFAPAAVASQAVNAANATNPRIDIVYVSSTGVISYLAGVAASAPTAPETPAGGVLLAQIAIAANATTITSANIIDKRITKNNNNVLQEQIGSLPNLSTTEKSNLVGAINEVKTQNNNFADNRGYITTKIADSQDCNTIIKNGKYAIFSGVNVPNSSTSYVLDVTQRDDGSVIQELVSLSTPAVEKYIRKGNYTGGTLVWTSWVKLATTKQEDWITATLQNGWTGSFQYRKNQIGQLEYKFSLTAGTVASFTTILVLPTEYRTTPTPNGNVWFDIPLVNKTTADKAYLYYDGGTGTICKSPAASFATGSSFGGTGTIPLG